MIARETVLLVDDEERLLNGLRRQLRGEFEIVTAVGGERALEILESQSEVAVIISDMRMPGVNGVEVLEAFSKKIPYHPHHAHRKCGAGLRRRCDKQKPCLRLPE